MTPRPSNAIVKRQALPIQTIQQHETNPVQTLKTTSSPKQLIPRALPALSLRVDAKERDVWLFFEQEYNQGWHPDSKYGTAAVKSIADCLIDLAQAQYADLRIEYFPIGDSTIREGMEHCRSLCTDSLASINADMQQISDKSGKLWMLDGSIMRALRSYTRSTEDQDAIIHHLNDIERTSKEILSLFTAIAERWHNFESDVKRLKEVLSAQLAVTKKGRGSIQDRWRMTQTELAGYKKEKEKLQHHVQRIHDDINTLNNSKRNTRKEVEELTSGKEDLERKLEMMQKELHHLNEEAKERPEEFKAAQAVETLRQRRRQEDKSQTGWSEWAWSTFVWDTTGESAALKAWKEREKEYKDWEASSTIQTLDLRKKIRNTKQEIEKRELRKRQLSGDKIQQKMERLESKERGVRSELVGTEPRLEELRSIMGTLTVSSEADYGLLEALDDYGKIVPGLCGNLGEVATNVDFSRRAYQQVLVRYKGCSAQLRELSRRMGTQKPSYEELNMMCDDVVRLRIVHLVMAFTSGWSSAMSKELYQDALRHIAPLGTMPVGSSEVPGRSIELGNTRKAHDDLYRLSQYAGHAADSLGKIQINGVEGLRTHVKDIISTVQEVRPSKPSKSWFSKKSKSGVLELPAGPENTVGKRRTGLS